ncbi:YdeI family protein [Noviherbaspirillum sp. UKPF54]|uniref:YdeI/OmpD-associated family protein n=1 Tax=Noviherbaspirillum sp. UKPF54 TaxID=2601898 RepID=UPI0011B11139|nr:YdeI/OmpD-associated family protein [Noviherbaspirillum sp. UKPF54]QDZ28513.1 bacteriocin-protection protein [Noviherbaspirillum sp. UKPF54]
MTDPRLTFASQEEWETWLERNGSSSTGVWLRLAKKSADRPTVSYAQALESALCYGWIDGKKQAESEHYWLQRFTPRTAKSLWSKVNKGKAEALIESGRMRPAGMQEINRAKQDGRWDAAYSPAGTATVPEDLQCAFAANPKAEKFFATLNSKNRYAILFRIQNAKKPETRARKIAQFIEMLSNGETLHS